MGIVYFYFVVLFCTCFISFRASESYHFNPCLWATWNAWSDCSSVCAGGTQTRFRSYSCSLDPIFHTKGCMAHCGIDYISHSSASFDSRGCNEICYNGGSFAGYCRCPDGFRGTCCKEVVTCGQPSTVSHGTFTGNNFTYAGKVRYTCDTNFNMTNPTQSTRTCTKDGQWNGSAPTCMYATSCNSNPCKNGASCVNLFGDYRCDCLSGWTGKNCEVDIQPPVVEGCPANRDIMTSNLTSRQIWSEPNITDPHGTNVSVTKNYQTSSFEFPWGEFTIQYSAVKISNGFKAECKFTISVKPFPCKKMDPPVNGILLCNGWRKQYSHICIFACKQNYTLPSGYKADDIYVCGATGHWLPANPVPQCVSEKLFPATKVQRFPSCTRPTDKNDMAKFYIDFLKKSAVNALCEQNSGDCKPENVDIEC